MNETERMKEGLAARACATLRETLPHDCAPTPSNVHHAACRTAAVAELLHNGISSGYIEPAKPRHAGMLQSIVDSIRVLAGIAEAQSEVLWEVTIGPRGGAGEDARVLLENQGREDDL